MLLLTVWQYRPLIRIPGPDAEPWKADDAAASVGEWHDGGDEPAFSGEFAQENVSKHAGERLCFNCGQPGHAKIDCTNPAVERPFDGSCRHCEAPGHRAKECPLKPCSKCHGEGHTSATCSVNRVFLDLASLGIKDLPIEEAWEMLEKADKERDVDEIKQYILSYAKAYPDVTLQDLEKTFRDNKMNTYLIATEKAVSKTHSIVNLQGKAEQKYVVSVQFSAQPRRAKMAESWPESPAQNLERLAEAGFPLDGKVVVCDSCKEVGHIRKSCPNGGDSAESTAKVMCVHCNEAGHRARDCNNRPKRGGGIVCHNCSEVCFFRLTQSSRPGKLICPEPQSERLHQVLQLSRRGSQEGSVSSSYRLVASQVQELRKCGNEESTEQTANNQQGEKGHGAKRCPQPPAEADENTAPAGDDGGNWGEGAAEGQGDSWGSGGQADNWKSGAADASANSGW